MIAGNRVHYLTGSDKGVIVGNGMLDLGGMDFRGVYWGEGKGSDVGGASGSVRDGDWMSVGDGNWVRNMGNSDWGRDNRSNLSNLWGWSDWEVGGSDTESVNGVSNVVHGLSNSIGINVRISSSNISEGVLALRLG
jgi:hypothetical protein